MIKRTLLISIFFVSMIAGAVEYVPGELIVKYKKGTKISNSAKVSSIGVSDTNLRLVKIGKTDDVFAAADKIAEDADVEYAQPNYIYHISEVPNDTNYSKQWALKNTPQTIAGYTPSGLYPTNNPGTAGDDISAESAWDILTDCSSIVVAIIDTGIKYNHEDLLANMWDGGVSYPNHGYRFSAPASDDPLDDNGHGTHVAGIIGAVGNNGVGLSGVCWTVQLMAVKSFAADGSATTATVVSGIDFAINNGANIINASFNFYGATDATLSAAVTAAQQAGILFVSAAGNGYENDGSAYNVDTGTKTYPCCFTQSNIMCVTALDQKYQRASFANYGTTSVDVGAPGTNIWSTWNTVLNKYAIESGTSMATPYAVGLAALVWANNPAYNYLDVKNAVMYGGTSVSSMSGKTVSGKTLDALGSLSYINSPTGLTAVVR